MKGSQWKNYIQQMAKEIHFKIETNPSNAMLKNHLPFGSIISSLPYSPR